MHEQDLRLDGNAAAGILSEVFTAEMTSATGTCANCGATNAIGATQLYAQAPGAVLRCPSCGAMLMCMVRFPEGGMVVDLSGLQRIRIN
jgi:DNA-directed RNA polymerase subunit RPC12/RpoP